MTRFSELIHASAVQVGAHARTKDEALRMAAALAARCSDEDCDLLVRGVRERERLSPTGIGDGVAVPHALDDRFGHTALGILRLDKPVPYGAPDGKPVDLIVLMVGPRSDSREHLQALSHLARILHDKAFLAALRAAPDAEALIGLMREKD